MIRFRGHWDGEAIIPDEPVDLENGRTLDISVSEVGETIWQRIARLADDMPKDLPEDFASQHDHYIHGRTKR